MDRELLQFMSEKLSELAFRDLGFRVRFEWPEDWNWDFRVRKTMELVVLADQKLSAPERHRLEDWMKSKLGAEWRPTIWERLDQDFLPESKMA